MWEHVKEAAKENCRDTFQTWLKTIPKKYLQQEWKDSYVCGDQEGIL